MRQCKKCGNLVMPYKKFSWFWFLTGLILFGVGAIVYLMYYAMKPSKCPMCNCKM